MIWNILKKNVIVFLVFMNKVVYFEIGVYESVKCENCLGNDLDEEEFDDFDEK